MKGCRRGASACVNAVAVPDFHNQGGALKLTAASVIAGHCGELRDGERCENRMQHRVIVMMFERGLVEDVLYAPAVVIRAGMPAVMAATVVGYDFDSM